jgi:hypothetical protein
LCKTSHSPRKSGCSSPFLLPSQRCLSCVTRPCGFLIAVSTKTFLMHVDWPYSKYTTRVQRFKRMTTSHCQRSRLLCATQETAERRLMPLSTIARLKTTVAKY